MDTERPKKQSKCPDRWYLNLPCQETTKKSMPNVNTSNSLEMMANFCLMVTNNIMNELFNKASNQFIDYIKKNFQRVNDS